MASRAGRWGCGMGAFAEQSMRNPLLEHNPWASGIRVLSVTGQFQELGFIILSRTFRSRNPINIQRDRWKGTQIPVSYLMMG